MKNFSNRKLHVISFDIPYPANYGGVIDVFYKLKALSALGIDITLHCFAYGREKSDQLKRYCKEVYYYKRHTGLKGISLTMPYIVYSRRNKQLLNRLLQDEAPILFEGIHTTYYLNHPALAHRKKVLRAHNMEHAYYNALAQGTSSGLKKIYYSVESKLLKRYEEQLQLPEIVACISEKEIPFFASRARATFWLPAFHAYDSVKTVVGKGTYCLFHGNFEVKENQDIALYLCKEVFKHLDIPLILAGKNPSEEIKACESNFIHVLSNPKEDHMQELIREAQIQVLPAFHAHGVKLKLLNALFVGRFCIVNHTMLEGTHISESILLANSTEEFQTTIQKLIYQDFTEADLQKREAAVTLYDVNSNALQLAELLFN